MKRLLLLFLSAVFIFAAAGLALADDDVKTYPNCIYCGMDREKFAHSRMLIEYEDGTVASFCSIHCAAVDLALKIDKSPKAIMAGDYSTKKLINAEKAFWVLGGNKMGVMTRRAKWAFAAKDSADNFIKNNGGTLIGFDDALKASYEDMNADTKMIRDKRKMKRLKSENVHQHTSHN